MAEPPRGPQGASPPQSGLAETGPRSRSPAPKGHVYAALDLGTNNCRLLIARPEADGFRVLDSFSRTVRLGEGLMQTGELSEAAICRAIEAIKVCAVKMRKRGVTSARAIATEACRTATNGPAFIKRVAQETGLHFDIIPPLEEARLAARGVTPLLDRRDAGALVFDIGGGSTELIWLDLRDRSREPRIIAWGSMPLGVVTLAELFPNQLDAPGIHAKMVAEVKTRLRAVEGLSAPGAHPAGPFHMLGTSGTVTTIAGIHLKLDRYERSKVDGTWLTRADALDVANSIASMDRDERAAQPCIGNERAELVIPGLAIFQAIFELWPAPRLRVADRGLREGMLLALMGPKDEPRRRRQRRRGRNRRFRRRGPKPNGGTK
ncbi:MAG: Ppx/GppA family phosphatase [Alphaproteobacteria bacterium]|nr:Ppx/GppA family phosphatase [Alphaproteobacteria bacterium]